MARALRIEFGGAIYHVTSRGNERNSIFRDAHDRERFLEKLGENVAAHGIRLFAYVLMGNHYHILMETPRANLSAFMQQFNTSYTVYYNHRHQRRGHLFEGRFKAKVVEGDRYLLALARYINLNPVKIKEEKDLPVVDKRECLRNYKWSSCRAYIGVAEREEFVTYDPLLELVSSGAKSAEDHFRDYVESGLARSDDELMDALGRSSKAIGEDAFCRLMEVEYRKRVEKAGRKLDVSMRRVEVGVPPGVVFWKVCACFGVDEVLLKTRRCTHPSRVFAMKLLKECAGLNHREIATKLGVVDGSGISRGIARLNRMLEGDEALRQLFSKLKSDILNH